jgi:hypothetical protein
MVLFDGASLFGLRFSPHLLNFALLSLEFSLLRFERILSLIVGHFLILHMVANQVAAHAAERATDRRSGSWISNCGTDDGACDGSNAKAAERPFLACCEWLS